MPQNSCQYFWKCPNCSEVLKASRRRLLCILFLW
ncbi:MAG: hypothetical protein U5J63_13550 [Fodinibius sp.]|nr:hypothetical protein [Fodinibius sp.]